MSLSSSTGMVGVGVCAKIDDEKQVRKMTEKSVVSRMNLVVEIFFPRCTKRL